MVRCNTCIHTHARTNLHTATASSALPAGLPHSTEPDEHDHPRDCEVRFRPREALAAIRPNKSVARTHPYLAAHTRSLAVGSELCVAATSAGAMKERTRSFSVALATADHAARGTPRLRGQVPRPRPRVIRAGAASFPRPRSALASARMRVAERADEKPPPS